MGNKDVDKKFKMYSPNGIAMITMNEGMKCNRSPADGAPTGHPEPQNRGNGSTPSFASSWLTRDWVNVMDMTFPSAERLTKTLSGESSQKRDMIAYGM